MPKTTEKKPTAPGVGESKIFGGHHQRPKGEIDIMECHVDSVPVKELPPEHQAQIWYAITDEGIAERMIKLREAGKVGGPKVEITKSEYQGKVEEFGDFRKDHPFNQSVAPDPLKEAADKHVGPGFVPKFLSDAVVAKRGRRGFEPVIDHNGDPVKVGGMTLARIPVAEAERRRAIAHEKSERSIRQIKAEHIKEQEQILSDGGFRPNQVQVPDLDQGLLRESGSVDLE